MKKMINRFTKYVKARPFDATIWGLITIGFLIVLYFIVIMIIPRGEDAFMGNRLAGIEQVQISDSRINAMSLDQCSETEVSIQGRIINITCTTETKLAFDAYDTLGEAALELFEDAELRFYDLQLIVAVANFEETDYTPVFGYRKADSDAETFSWTRNRRT